MGKIRFEESKNFTLEDNETPKTKEEENKAVDDIFASADETIKLQNSASEVTPKQHRKKKRLVRSLIITLIVCVALAIVAIVVGGVIAYKMGVAELKAQVIDAFYQMKDSIPEEERDSLEGQYVMKMLDLFSEEDINYIIDNSLSLQNTFENLEKIINLKSNADLDIIPAEKREAMKKLIDEYNELKAKEIEEQKNNETSETVESEETSPIDPNQNETTSDPELETETPSESNIISEESNENNSNVQNAP